MTLNEFTLPRVLAIITLALATSAGLAQSTRWPERPVRIIVPFPPGGSTDIAARIVAPRLAEEYGQQFVVDNRGGAGGTIGAEMAARATPDGYTIAVVASSYSANAAIYKLPYDPVRGIAPVSMIGMGPFILGVRPNVEASTLKEFIELARAKPKMLLFGMPGAGSSPHLAGELLQQMTKTQMTNVPYKGDTPALTDLLGGQIHVMIASGPVFLPHIRSGKVRPLAVTTERRAAVLPDLPAIAELVPGYAASGWNGVWAPAGTPPEIIARLNRSMSRILKQPDLIERLRADGREPTYTTPEEFAQLIAREIGTWTRVVKIANIKIN